MQVLQRAQKKRAVVLGGSIAGLMVAHKLASLYKEVVLVEKVVYGRTQRGYLFLF